MLDNKTESNFFYYDPEGDGFQQVETLQSAEDQAKAGINGSRNEGEWSDEVEDICIGVILKHARKSYSVSRPPDSMLDPDGYDHQGNWWGREDEPDTPIADYDEICDYTLEPVKIPDEVLALIPTADLDRELKKRNYDPSNGGRCGIIPCADCDLYLDCDSDEKVEECEGV